MRYYVLSHVFYYLPVIRCIFINVAALVIFNDQFYFLSLFNSVFLVSTVFSHIRLNEDTHNCQIKEIQLN